ncbi:hypothetical protein GWI33_011096 [Rhynchophorus ferrugineus]|uniref:RING-type domain-containing protein n=1 Tax=Rhynchophorus ferrugineus TaxID=354439 RepID=A0A834MBU5_RHYFE|nr:hypothetical protein GWI33_011096 [Rhynchophorus ferrugineus]
MSLRARLLAVVEVLMRVPPIFVVDEILKLGFGFADLSQDLSDSPPSHLGDIIKNDHENATFSNISTYIPFDSMLSKFIVLSVMIRFLFAIVGCLSAMCMFVLNMKHLMVVYIYLMSVGLAMLSYFFNFRTIKDIMLDEDYALMEAKGWMYQLTENCVLQSLFSFIFTNIHLGPRFWIVQKLLPLSFLVPTFLALLPVSETILKLSSFVSTLLPLTIITVILWSSFMTISNSLYMGYHQMKTMISNFGVSALVESEWGRLNVPDVLRTFWVLRTLEHAITFFVSGMSVTEDGTFPYFIMMKYLLVNGCDTLTAVLGLTSVVSYVCNYIGKFFQWVLLTGDESDKNFGTVSAIVFYILALQTGLTGLGYDVRFVRLCRNFCLLFTALLHFTHNIVNLLLMSLSASHNPSIRRHVHALIVCATLIVLSLMLMYLLWTTQEISTWLLAVTAFSIEVIVKVLVSLAIYALFLYDARRESFWEQLDDYIYYIRSFGNAVEFCFAIFLFFNGAWILLFESGSAIRAVMMCIHAYFNIWCDAKAGWSVFMKRRTAVNKIESLPEADRDQLLKLDDVCAICYQEMQSAKITKCNHFFHGVCLRKWLYVQDRCPLCHEILHLADPDDRTKPSDNPEPPGAAPAAAAAPPNALVVAEHHQR